CVSSFNSAAVRVGSMGQRNHASVSGVSIGNFLALPRIRTTRQLFNGSVIVIWFAGTVATALIGCILLASFPLLANVFNRIAEFVTDVFQRNAVISNVHRAQ